MSFVQTAPALGNQYSDDRVLRAYLERTLGTEALAAAQPQLERMGALAGGELYAQQLAERELEPRLVQWDAWGNRVDRIELTPLWQRAEQIAAREGLIALPHEAPLGALSRVLQFALVYLFTPSTDVYACPLAMSDGAARTLAASGNRALIERALPHLLSRDPAQFWTSGQWMTEPVGGSDVGLAETEARFAPGEGWRLYGRKYFTSAIASQMALTLARPTDNAPGGKGLALLGLSVDEPQDAARVETFRQKYFAAFRSLVRTTSNMYDAVAPLDASWNEIVPTTYILGRDGKILARVQGKKTQQEFRAAALEALKAD